MLGGQFALSAPFASDFKSGLTGSYYHYRLGSVAGADAGDFRGNLISGGRYLSDFHLLEGIGTLGWSGLSPRWPVSFTADYVKNLGARSEEHTSELQSLMRITYAVFCLKKQTAFNSTHTSEKHIHTTHKL